MGVVLLACLALFAGRARAGTWVQVSCVNPNGSTATSEGWKGGASGPFAIGGNFNTQCGPGSPMVAAQNIVFGPVPSQGSGEAVTYTPPAGSTLAGGSVDVALETYGYGTSTAPAGSIGAVTSPTSSDVLKIVSCGGPNCSSNTFGPAVVSLPTDRGGTVTVGVGCDVFTLAVAPCNHSNNASIYARARVYSADLRLSTNAQPQASGFHGSALEGNVSGTAGLIFTVSDPVGSGANPPSGPGIYTVTVQLDGKTVFAATPDTNGGACVPVGGGGGNPLMFGSAQPCPSTETVDVPVPTSGLPDGRHHLVVMVTDAAGDTTPVLDRSIPTDNSPQVTPIPRGRRQVRARFVLFWHFNGRRTTLRSVRGVRNLPSHATVSVFCRGRDCRHLATRASGAHSVKRALRGLVGHRFTAGDRLYITVTAPGRKAERIVIRIRNGRLPTAAVLPR